MKKLVREHINEIFTEDSDPIKDLNIGKKNQILTDLKEIGITENDINFFDDDYTFYMKESNRVQSNEFYDIQLKYFPKGKRELLRKLEQSQDDITDIIDEAIANGVEKEDIMLIIKYMLPNLSWNNPRYHSAHRDLVQAEIYLHKIGRSRKQKKEEDENNIYVFIGYIDKVPVDDVKGKEYYEDKFAVEKMVKIDKYNIGQLQNIEMMKQRARSQYGGQPGSGVFMFTVPKDLMDDDYYDEIPRHCYDLVVKYKQKI